MLARHSRAPLLQPAKNNPKTTDLPISKKQDSLCSKQRGQLFKKNSTAIPAQSLSAVSISKTHNIEPNDLSFKKARGPRNMVIATEKVKPAINFSKPLTYSPFSLPQSFNKVLAGLSFVPSRGMAHITKGDRWVGNIIPYKMGKKVYRNVALRNKIYDAIKEYETKTLIRFKSREEEGDYILFRLSTSNDTSSNSEVGHIDSRTEITLYSEASVSVIIHEIGHALGLKHEHTRRDRDDHVIVHMDRVIDGKQHNFEKESESESIHVGSYDTSSIMHYKGYEFRKKIRYDWSSGWTTVKTFKIGAQVYLFLLKEGNGIVHIHRMNNDGTAGDEIQKHDWSSGWTSAEFYTINGTTYLFLLKEGNGNVDIHRMNNDGTIGDLIQEHDWSSGWSTVEFYKTGGSTYLFLLKEESGRVDIHRINANGTVGDLIQQHDWSSGWTSAKFYTIAGTTYLFLLKEDSGRVDIHRINGNGTVGDLIQQQDWSSGWSMIEFYTIRGTTYLFLLKENGGRVDIHRMHSNGTIGDKIIEYNWTSGWTSANFFQSPISLNTYLFLLKENDGTVHMHRMEIDGTVGPEPEAGNTIEPKVAGTSLGNTTLSKSDIIAINSLTLNNLYIYLMNTDGSIGQRLDARVWLNQWDLLRFYHVSGNTFLFSLKQDNGHVYIHQMNSNGTIGNRIQQHDWSAGWTNAEFYTINGTTYLFLLKEGDGNVDIHRMNSNGTVGELIQEQDWSSGWTTVKFYTINNVTYLFLLKEDNGRVDIHQMNDDGRIGSKIQEYDWTSGWTNAEFYTINGKTYLFLLKERDGNVDIHIMNDDGRVGTKIQDHNWSSGWSNVNFFIINNQVYLFLLKGLGGLIDIHRMNDDGTVGPQINRYDLPAFASRQGFASIAEWKQAGFFHQPNDTKALIAAAKTADIAKVFRP